MRATLLRVHGLEVDPCPEQGGPISPTLPAHYEFLKGAEVKLRATTITGITSRNPLSGVAIAPISGASPEAEEFTPTTEDLEDDRR
jgi:hypothetical protein